MDKLLQIIEDALHPESTWGGFFRKTLSTLLVAGIGAYSFNVYQRMQQSHWEALPLHTAVLENGIKTRVNKYLQLLVEADESLLSVWLYSWPDARSLIPVAHAGDHMDPLPLGYLLRSDSPTIGELVVGQCDCLNRPGRKLLACPIMTSNDAWGMILFEHELDTERPENYRGIYVALAHKLANLIYNNHD